MRTAVTLAFVWLLVSPACSTTATANAPQPVHVIEISALEGMLGYTIWDCDTGYPATWGRLHYRGIDLVWVDENGELWATDGFRRTVAHETRHKRQALETGDCEKWKELRRDSTYRERSEFDARCAELAVGQWIPCNKP